jgi:RNA polymerase sigma-70 factor, ECF subfamily
VLTSLKSWVRPDGIHAVLVHCLGERSVRWYNACLRITRDADLAADAVQEALLKAWDRRAEFRGESELDTWIHRIALNAAIDLMRRRRPQATAELDTEYLMAANSPHGEYVQEALSRDLITAMQRLTTMERQTFVLKHIEGWRLEEIAESLQTNANNTKQALFRAVRKLRVDLHVWRGES